jgi:hypothetical protein
MTDMQAAASAANIELVARLVIGARQLSKRECRSGSLCLPSLPSGASTLAWPDWLVALEFVLIESRDRPTDCLPRSRNRAPCVSVERRTAAIGCEHTNPPAGRDAPCAM